jgi:hypothetical protein
MLNAAAVIIGSKLTSGPKGHVILILSCSVGAVQGHVSHRFSALDRQGINSPHMQIARRGTETDPITKAMPDRSKPNLKTSPAILGVGGRRQRPKRFFDSASTRPPNATH